MNRTGGRRRLIAHLLLIALGAVIMIIGVVVLVDPTPSCRGVRLAPGDRCVKTDGSQAQSYAQLARQGRIGGAVALGTGVLVIGFGAVLVRQERSRRDDTRMSS